MGWPRRAAAGRSLWRNRRAWLFLLTIPSALLVTLLATSRVILVVVEPPRPSPTAGVLTWDKAFGSTAPTPNAPDSVALPPMLKSVLLSHVLGVDHAVEARGEWILLDGRLGEVNFLDTSTGSIRSLGRAGPGPGEFDNPVGLAAVDSTLWILNRRGRVLDRFTWNGSFLSRRELRGGGCPVGLAKGMVFPGAGEPLALRFCPPSLPGPGTAWIERVSGQGTLTPVLSLELGHPGSRRLHLGREPILTGRDGRFFLGTWDTPCFLEFDAQGRTTGRRCLPPYPRPRTDAGERERLAYRFRSLGRLGLLPLEIPAYLPWHDRAFATPQGLVVSRIRGPEERDLVLLPTSGRPSRIGQLFPRNTFVGNRTILVVHDLLHATRIDLYPNPWAGRPQPPPPSLP